MPKLFRQIRFRIKSGQIEIHGIVHQRFFRGVAKVHGGVADDPPPAFKNNGFVFDYEAETLSMPELHELTPVIRQLADSRNVNVYMEWKEFERPQIHVEGEPLCAEPWKTLYVLNRGIMPCAFGAKPLVNWNQQGNRKLDDFLRDVFNSDEYREIRTELAAGRMPRYCRGSLGCPILKRMPADAR